MAANSRASASPTAVASWHKVTAAKPPAPATGQFNGVACPAANSCLAVGSSYNNNTNAYRRHVQRWNGTKWAIEVTPAPTGSTQEIFHDVSCFAADACTAVGQYMGDPNKGWQALIERWNGSTWSIQKSASPDSYGTGPLKGVSCPTRTSCYAVGDRGYSFELLPFVEHWNGTKWSAQSAPTTAGIAPSYAAIDCTSNTNCVAVGSAVCPDCNLTYLVLHRWNGTKWADGNSAYPNNDSHLLSDVACASASNCVAVGYQMGDNGFRRFVERWNGTSWVNTFTPLPPGAANTFAYDAAGCRRGGKCFIAGASKIAEWNGSAFVLDTNPNVGASIADIACDPTNCTAVGTAGAQPVVLRTP